MKRMRKLVSIILVLSLCFTLGLSTTAYATSENLESPTSVYTFLDSEGKENSLEMTLLPEGQVKSTLYIEGAFIATTTAQYNTETDQIHINRVANAGPSINVTVPLSTYISSEYVSPLPSRSTANASYNKEGTIFYNPLR